MKFSVGSLVLLLVTTSLFLVIAMANKNGMCTPCPPCRGVPGGSLPPPWPGMPPAAKPKTIVVGGNKQKWDFGFNYTNWTLSQPSPFFMGDTLVFKYKTPHNVVLLPNYDSYIKCDVSKAQVIGNVSAGGGKNGFKFTLKPKKPYEDPSYYFACSASGGFHCKTGMMKFFVYPFPRLNN